MNLTIYDKLTKYDFPVARIGNTKNPLFIILLENQNSDPEYCKFNPEYTMRVEGKFKPKVSTDHIEHMDFETVIEYDKWWFDLSKYWVDSDLHITKSEVLALEYYPYSTLNKNKENEIYNVKWEGINEYAKKALEINKSILAKALGLNIPVFVYYKSGWYGDRGINDINPILNRNQSEYVKDYDPKATVPSLIRSRLKNFLSEPHIKKRVIELRKNNNYVLNMEV